MSDKKLTPAIGVDVGTANLCVCRRDVDGNFVVSHHRNMLLEMDASDEASDLLARSSYLYLKSNGKYYVVGEDALKLVNAIGHGNILRPMQDGLLNPNLKSGQALMNHILEVIVGKPLEANEPLRFSVPANPVDRPETNNLFHSMILTEFFKGLGYSAKPINEALCNIYNEAPSMVVDDESMPLTGLSASFGAGMCNACLAVNGLPTVEFSITKSGDHIDNQVSAVTGERTSKIVRVKERELDLSNIPPDNNVLRALGIYYDELLARTLNGIAKEFTRRGVSLDGSVDMVICGGTAMAKGFVPRAKMVIEKLDLPFKIKDVRLASNPFYSVSQGACLAAMSDWEKRKVFSLTSSQR